MKIKKIYHELLVTSLILNFFDSALTTITAFSIIYFLIYFYRFDYIVAVIASIVFFVWSFIRKIRENKILVIERKYPNMKERLRTSYDNQGENNEVVNSLHKDIARMMKKVDVNAYLTDHKIIFKVLTTCTLFFSVLYFSSIGLDALDIKTRIVTSDAYHNIEEFVEAMVGHGDDGFDDRTRADPRLIVLGDEELKVTVDTFNTELDISEISESEEDNDFGGHYPEEIKGAAQQIYEENIPEEDKEVVREYFKKING